MKINRFLIIIFLFISCQVDLETKPNNLINEKKMELIMQDMILIKAISKKYKIVINQENWFGDEYLYEKYKIDCLNLIESQNYYAKSPKIYLEIHNKIKANMERMIDSIDFLSKDEIKKIKEKESYKKDSINKIKANMERIIDSIDFLSKSEN